MSLHQKDSHKASTNGAMLDSASPFQASLLDLSEAFPQIIRDGFLSTEALLALAGSSSRESGARFGLVWPDRELAEGLIREGSVGALLPAKGSYKPSEARHCICIGDNLEVMKLLHRTYFGRFKVIYFDPTYSDALEEIYQDDYADPLGGYLRKYGLEPASSDSSDEPSRRRLGSHSRWLNMMMPRLFAARNLLREDGVIFVSIDDHEIHHLRMLMDEIFGEENFVCTFIWEKRYAPAPDAPGIGYVHENILCYRRTDDFAAALLPMTEMQKGRYRNPDKDRRGPWKPADYTCRFTARQRPTLYYAIENPNTGKSIWPKKTRVWACSKGEHLKNVAERRIWWPDGATVPAKKKFLNEIRQGSMPKTLLTHKEVGHTDEATKELRRWSPNVKVTPKPTRLLRHLIRFAGARGGDLILDALARVGTMGEAVALENAAGAGLRTILIQPPDKTGTDARQTYSDITVKRTVGALKAGTAKTDGVRIFNLARSGFQRWQVEAKADAEAVKKQLERFASTVMPRAKKPELAAELFLRSGCELADRYKIVPESDSETYLSEDGGVAICLKDSISAEDFTRLLALKADRIICLDSAIAKDELRLNALRQAKGADIELITV